MLLFVLMRAGKYITLCSCNTHDIDPHHDEEEIKENMMCDTTLMAMMTMKTVNLCLCFLITVVTLTQY